MGLGGHSGQWAAMVTAWAGPEWAGRREDSSPEAPNSFEPCRESWGLSWRDLNRGLHSQSGIFEQLPGI